MLGGGLWPWCSGSDRNGGRVLTVAGAAGPAEAPPAPGAPPAGGLAALPQGRAAPQGQGGVLGAPVGDEAVLLAPGGGQGAVILGHHVPLGPILHSRILQDSPSRHSSASPPHGAGFLCPSHLLWQTSVPPAGPASTSLPPAQAPRAQLGAGCQGKPRSRISLVPQVEPQRTHPRSVLEPEGRFCSSWQKVKLRLEAATWPPRGKSA